MKKIKTAFIILAILGFIIFLVYNDYAWADKAIKAYQKEGWDIVAAKSDNYVPFGSPWAFIKPFVTQITLLKSSDIKQFNEQFMVANVMFVNNEPERSAEIFRDIYDCQNNKSAYIESSADIQALNFDSLKWNEYSEDTPGFQTIKKVCEFKK